MLREDGIDELKGMLPPPSYMAKGLELDAAIICDADSHNYLTAMIKCVECPRALHRLRFFPPRGAYAADRRMLIEEGFRVCGYDY